MTTLYDFQEAALNAAHGIISRKTSEIIVMPAGAGKSVVAAAIVRNLTRPYTRRRVLILSHVQEIVEQDVAAIEAMLPQEVVGIACAGLGRVELGRRVTVASIQSIYDRTYAQWSYDVIIVDEAHLISRKDSGMYRQFFAKVREDQKKDIPIIGLTATPYRLDSGYLHIGDGALFTRIAYEVPLMPLISRKILAPLTTGNVTEIDFSSLPVYKADFKISVYTESDDSNWLAESQRAITYAMTVAADRKRWIVYCCTIKHAEAIAKLLVENGVQALPLYSGMGRKARAAAITAFRNGTCRVLVNVNILAIGFNVPDVDCIVLLRPTLSTGAYVQMLGRGMRIAPGKTDCLVLDFAGNVARHGPISDIVPKVMNFSIRDRVGRLRPCPTCGVDIAPFTKQCAACGHLFASIDAATPSSSEIMFPGDGSRVRTRKIPVPLPPPVDAELLATEEVAYLLGTTVQYIKQMRTLKMGPQYRRTGGLTNLGWRQIVYDVNVVQKWMNNLVMVSDGKNGRTYRMTREGYETLKKNPGKRREGKSDPTVTQPEN